MAVYQGRFAKVQVSTDDVTYDDIEKITDASISYNIDETEKTNHDSNGFREYEAGHRDGTASLSAIYDEDATAQEVLWTAFLANPTTTLYFKFQHQQTAGVKELTTQAFITNMEVGLPLEEMQTLDISLRLTGATTRADQA